MANAGNQDALNRVRAYIQIALITVKLLQARGLVKIKELPDIEEIVTVVDALLQTYAETPAPTKA